MEIAFSIRLICADRVIVGEEGDDTQGHEQEVISDTLLVLLDFLAYFQQNHSQPYNVVTSATIDPFTERLNDRLAGNSVTIQIRQPFDWNKCQIPQTGAIIPPTVDGLTLYNFCDPSVIARLTNEQVACLIAQYNEPCEDATITINSAPFGTAPSGGTLNVPVVNGGDNPVGSEQGGEWVIGNSEVFINAVQVADIVAEDTANLAVELDGVPSGSWNAGTQTWEVTSTPCADGSVEINGDFVANVASGGMVNIMVEQDGNPVGAFDPNSNSWVIPPCGAGGSVSLAISDTTPFVGDVITLTATATGFTPTSYTFRIEYGTNLALIVTQAGNTYNWTVPASIGTYTVYVLATDGSSNVYKTEGITINAVYLLDAYPTNNITDFATFRLLNTFTGRIMEVRRTVGATTTAVEIGLDGDYVTLNSPVLAVTVGSSTAATLGEFVAATGYANPDGITANQSAFVVRGYRQLNGALACSQTTAVNQPRLVNAGVLDVQNGVACLVFSGNQWLAFGLINGGTKPANYSLLGVGRMLGGATSMCWCGSIDPSPSAGTAYGVVFNDSSSPNKYETYFSNAASQTYQGKTNLAVFNNQQQLFEMHKTSGVSRIDLHVDGSGVLAMTDVVNQTNNNGGTERSLSLGRFGEWNNRHLFGSAQMLVAYNSNQTANRTGMKGLINTILGTSW
jgi:hypothetical protein